MKNKKGFTLIELLAVIVVLAVIALIATPIVMNTIKNVKKGAAERSVDRYIKQIATTVATEKLTGNILDGEYIVQDSGNLCPTSGCGNDNEDKIFIEMSGTKPSGGIVKISNGNVQVLTKIMIEKYDVTYNTSTKKYEATEKENVEVLCTKQDGVDLNNLTYGNEFTCELGDNDKKTFYVLETNDDSISLIMNMNVDSNGKGTLAGNNVSWCKSGSTNSCGGDGALEYLSTSTKSWKKLTQQQITLPTGEQIAKAGGDTKWNTGTYGECFESKPWLYINLSNSHEYWTLTPYSGNSTHVWSVNFYGELGNNDVGDTQLGIRPVIIISKANLS